MDYALAEIVINKWWIALYGWITYNIIIWWVEKEKADKLKESFNYRIFARTHIDNWIVSCLLGLPVLYVGPEMHAFIMKHFVPEAYRFAWSDFFYAGAAANVEVIYFFITEGIPILKKRVLKWFDKERSSNTPEEILHAVPPPVPPAQQGSDETPS